MDTFAVGVIDFVWAFVEFPDIRCAHGVYGRGGACMMCRPRQAEIVITLNAVNNGGALDSHDRFAELKALCQRGFGRAVSSVLFGRARRARGSMFAVRRFGYSAAASYERRCSSSRVGG